MSVLYDVQKAVFQRLVTNEPLMERVTGVYDFVPDSTNFPYVIIGRIFSTPIKTKTTVGEKVEVTIDIWSDYNGKKETIDIMDLLEAALTDDISVDGVFLVSQEVKSREVLEEVNDLYHGTLIFEFVLDMEG